MTEHLDPATATVTVYEDGPVVIRGDFDLLGQDGAPFGCNGRSIALCRCGRSAVKPFCDGNHKPARFRAPGTPGAGTGDRRLSGLGK